MEDTAMGALDELPLLTRHRLTVADYYRMAEVGVLGPQARVELIDGEVIDMAPIGSRHHAAVLRLSRQLQFAVGDHALVSVQGPLSLGEFSQPEPDLMLLQARADFYAAAHPVATDVLLLIEVADTSARYDREIKLPLYARHGVTEVWIVDLHERCVRFFRQPAEGRYLDATSTETPGRVTVPCLPGVTLDLAGVLG
jgi:Uma2 family endonuclease